MTVKLNPAALASEYTRIKAVVNGFDGSTPVEQIQAEKLKLESLNERVTALINTNPVARMSLSMAIPGIPMLINKCSGLISTATVVEGTFKKRVSLNDNRMTFQTAGRPVGAPDRRPPTRKPRTQHTDPAAAPVATAPQPSAPVITEIKVKCQIPFGHTLRIHGQGGDLNWPQGKELEKVDDETYVYRMENVTGKVEYKFVLDGSIWEGCQNNHSIEAEKTEEIVPSLLIPKVPVIVNFGDSSKKVFIRGTGPGMNNWCNGIELKPVQGKFVLETNVELGNFEFKVLINDQQWSSGENFKVENGKTIEITPNF